jgi:hypothetical protein
MTTLFEPLFFVPNYFRIAAGAEIARLAVLLHGERLFARHPNIACISDTVKHAGEYVVAIYLKDHDTKALPTELTVPLPDGSETVIKTEIVAGMGEARLQLGQSTTKISDSGAVEYYGSMCCLVESITVPGFIGAVTSGHVMTHGAFSDYGGVLAGEQQRSALIDGQPDANWYFQKMRYNQDLAIARIYGENLIGNDYISFAAGYYDIEDKDISTPEPNITIASRNNNVRDAFILDYNVSLEINYNMPVLMRNLIFIGTVDNRNESQSISQVGDSGSCVYHKETNKLIGMLLGGNDKFSFVLPLRETLESFNFKPL